jgi:hypothetical protein|tara:strand:- start:557 stop:787 length:231 start_codon:yes stop_codon:yes gene_type:complete
MVGHVDMRRFTDLFTVIMNGVFVGEPRCLAPRKMLFELHYVIVTPILCISIPTRRAILVFLMDCILMEHDENHQNS